MVVIAAVPFPGDRTLKIARHAGDGYACIDMASVFVRRLEEYMGSD